MNQTTPPNKQTEESFSLYENDELDDDEYLDDEPVRKPNRTARPLRKFRHPQDR